MQNEQFSKSEQSYSSLVKELLSSSKELISNEITLAKEEFRETASGFFKHALEVAAFGGLVALSTIPLMAFLVIGLGELLGGNYWLSSLLVGIVCAGIGGALAYRSFQKIKESDLDLPRTRRTLEIEKNIISEKLGVVKKTA